MRIMVLFGLGLPVLAVSGAVAYAAIQDISKSFEPTAFVQDESAEMPVSPQAVAFVAAGVSGWSAPQQNAFGISAFQDDSVLTKVPSALSHSSDNDAPAVVVVNSVTPKPRPAIRKAVKAETIDLKQTRLREQAPKRVFKMPWQTGIFQ